MLRAIGLRAIGLRSSALGCQPRQRQYVLHVPALATVAKLAGATAAKKVAFSQVIRRVGPEATLSEIRKMNQRLRSSTYGEEVANAADASLDALEHSLKAVQGNERVQLLWSLYTQLEKQNPTLADAVFKTWLDALPGVRWANALLKGTPSPSGRDGKLDGSKDQHAASSSEATFVKEAAAAPPSSAACPGSDEHVAATIERLHMTHPEIFELYHVALIPRVGNHSDASQNDAGQTPTTSGSAGL